MQTTVKPRLLAAALLALSVHALGAEGQPAPSGECQAVTIAVTTEGLRQMTNQELGALASDLTTLVLACPSQANRKAFFLAQHEVFKRAGMPAPDEPAQPSLSPEIQSMDGPPAPTCREGYVLRVTNATLVVTEGGTDLQAGTMECIPASRVLHR